MPNPACPDCGEQDRMRRVKGGGYVCGHSMKILHSDIYICNINHTNGI